jgi:hypothetical protein
MLIAISDEALKILKQIAACVATSANPTHKADRAHAFVMDPNSFNFVQGS